MGKIALGQSTRPVRVRPWFNPHHHHKNNKNKQRAVENILCGSIFYLLEASPRFSDPPGKEVTWGGSQEVRSVEDPPIPEVPG